MISILSVVELLSQNGPGTLSAVPNKPDELIAMLH
jgi:hypothetical protein